jgi:adenylate cyclase
VSGLARLRGRFKITRREVASLFGALIAVTLGLAIHTFPGGQGVAQHSYELQLVARGDVRVKEAMIVYMDEASYSALKQPLNAPWDRVLHAQLIDRLTKAGARAIAFDIIFSDPDLRNPEADERLAQAIRESGRVILGIDVVHFGQNNKKGFPPVEVLSREAASAGSVEALADTDLVVRRLNAWDDDLGIPSLSLSTAAMVQKVEVDAYPNLMGERWMNYYGPPHFLPSVNYAQALDPTTDERLFKDKIVFVGARIFTKFAGERKDEYVHPFAFWMSQSMMKQGRVMNFIAGVEIQATACVNLLRGDWLTRLPKLVERMVVVMAGLAFGFGLVRLRPIMATVVGLGGLGAIVVLLQVLFNQKLIWFPFLILVLQIGLALAWSILFNSVQFYVQQQLSQQMLGLYLSPKLVKKFAGNPEMLKPGADELPISIFFSDIEDFTEMSRHMDSDSLARLMNEYFETAVSKCIHPTDGTLVKYLGDAIFAIWNAPETQRDHAWRACCAALRFREQKVHEGNGRPLRTRIGVHTGLARVGNFGSANRVDYTALGESVNFASRLEGLNKVLGTDCVISSETRQEIDDRLITRSVGFFQLKGFGHPIEVFELVGWPAQAEESRAWRETFAQALDHYRAGRLAEAEEAFRRTLTLRPKDGPSAFYLARLEELRVKGGTEVWAPYTILREK